jgi:sulfur relay (sulfurtransferase) DsrC/TusE family protein
VLRGRKAGLSNADSTQARGCCITRTSCRRAIRTAKFPFADLYRARTPTCPGHRSVTPHQRTTTMSLQAALSYMRFLKKDESFSYRIFAEKFGINRTTLSTDHQGRRKTISDAHQDQRLLHQCDEVELVKYIRSFMEKHCPPKRQMIKNFAAPLGDWEPSDRWVTRLISRHPDHLLTAWTTPMEGNRHDANSSESYER